MKIGRVKGGSIIPATIDTGRRKRSSIAQPVFNASGLSRGIMGGAAQNIIEITSDDLVQNGGNYSLMGGPAIPMQIVTGRRSKQGAAQVVYPVDILGNYDPTFAGYIYKVLTPDAASGYDPSSLIGFWPQKELSGGVSIDYSGLGHHGAYTAVTLGQAGVPGMGMSSAGYDGATSFNNIYSASLNTAFSGAEGALLIWTRVANAGVWTDGAFRRVVRLAVDGNNFIYILKFNTNNKLEYTYKAAGITEATAKTPVSETGWMRLGIVWNKAGTGFQAYYNGVPEGALQAIAGIWAGNLAVAECVIGATSTVPANVWLGSDASVLLFNKAKTAAEMAYLSTP